jgi:asparagine synthase (glutamine-hydrolysing)
MAGISGCIPREHAFVRNAHDMQASSNAMATSLRLRVITRNAADAIAEDARFLVAIAGAPRWASSERSADARQRGHHAALLAAAHEQGFDLLDQLRGAFSLLIVDKQQRRSLLAVDRFGIERLCYALTPAGELVFAPSALEVASARGVSRDIDPGALYQYFFFHMVPSPLTIFPHVSKLEPGHRLTFSHGSLTVDRYFKPRFHSTEPAERPELERELLTSLRSAVERTLDQRATGAFLSGGLDSSSVVGFLAELRKPARAYSIGFSEERYNELEFARVAARHFGAIHRERLVTPADIAAAIPLIARSYDEPFGNSSAVPAYYCAQTVAEDGIEVVLAGDGGDELFAGNSRYVQQLKLESYQRIPRALRSSLFEPLLADTAWPAHVPLVRKVASYVRQARVPLPDRLESWNHFVRTPPREILHPELVASVDAAAPVELMRRVYGRSTASAAVDRMLELDWQQTLADNDLRKVVRTCELAGVDVRFPMLDDDLAEFSMRVPAALKIRGLRLRDFYRRACQGFLPAEVLGKRKHGFALPFGVWMAEDAQLREIGHASLNDLKRRRLLRDGFLDDLVTRHGSEHAAYYGELIWVLVMFEQWMQAHSL